jgi:glutamine amidotransferase
MRAGEAHDGMRNGTLAVVDSGGGNLGSLLAALERRGVTPILTQDPAVVDAADAAILPGDGAFAATMRALEERGLDRAIHGLVARGRPFLGICVGMQLLFEASEEHEHYAGLGILPGTIRRFEGAPRVPHMGWNDLELVVPHPFVANVASGDYVYFLHSYRADVGPHTLAAATHGERFAAIVAQGNVMGTQFHPEKSQVTGARLLDNFLALRHAV